LGDFSVPCSIDEIHLWVIYGYSIGEWAGLKSSIGFSSCLALWQGGWTAFLSERPWPLLYGSLEVIRLLTWWLKSPRKQGGSRITFAVSDLPYSIAYSKPWSLVL